MHNSEQTQELMAASEAEARTKFEAWSATQAFTGTEVFAAFDAWQACWNLRTPNKERAVTDNTAEVNALMQLVAEYGQRRWSEGLHAGSFSRIAEKHDRAEAADLSEQIKLAAEKLAAPSPQGEKDGGGLDGDGVLGTSGGPAK